MRLPLSLRVAAAVTVAVAVCTSTLAVTAYALESSSSKGRFVQTSLHTARADFAQATQIGRQAPPRKQPAAVRAYFARRGLAWRQESERGFAGDGCVDDRVPDGLGNDFIPGPLQHAWVRLCSEHHTLAVYGAPVSGVNVAEFFDYQPVINQLRHLRTVLLWLGGIAIAVAVLVGLLVGRLVARPVTRAARTAQRFGEDLSARLPAAHLRGAPEFVELGTAFNTMADRVQTAADQQRKFVADVAHELRTPLAAMLAASNGMTSDDPDRRHRSEELLAGQTRRLVRMVDDLLEISRFDAGEAELVMEAVDLEALVRDAAQSIGPETPVGITTVGDVAAEIDSPRVHAIVRNLIANAVQHGAPPVDVRIEGRESDVTITVTDGGDGVPPELADGVFNRYVRGDGARSTGEGHGSTGLGLAIARENAVLHGGTITLASRHPTEFTVTLPRRPQDTSGE